MKSFAVTSVLLLTSVLAAPSVAEAQARRVLEPSDLCSEHSDASIATFEDADVEAAVRRALGVSAQEDLTCGLVSGLTALAASGAGPVRTVTGSPRFPPVVAPFESLVGIQNLTGLTSLTLNNKSITDISPLSGLTNLTVLRLHTNWITDISPLRGMTKLTDLFLSENSFSDISALSGMTELRVLRLHKHGDFTGVQLPRDFQGVQRLDNNPITDITPLRRLTNLRDLNLHTNAITDVSALSGLTALNELRINGNQIKDIRALSGLTALTRLELTGNQITDISVLKGLTALTGLDLRFNAELSNIQPLLDNPELGAGDRVELLATSVTCGDVALLRAKGVEVGSFCGLL